MAPKNLFVNETKERSEVQGHLALQYCGFHGYREGPDLWVKQSTQRTPMSASIVLKEELIRSAAAQRHRSAKCGCRNLPSTLLPFLQATSSWLDMFYTPNVLRDAVRTFTTFALCSLFQILWFPHSLACQFYLLNQQLTDCPTVNLGRLYLMNT